MTGSGAQPALYPIGKRGLFLLKVRRLGCKANYYVCPVVKLRMRGVIPPLHIFLSHGV